MKRSIACLCMCGTFFLTGKLQAQSILSLPQTDREKAVELRQIEAFNGREYNAIPFVSGRDLSDFTDPGKKIDCTVKLQPLSENPELTQAFSDNKTTKNSLADLTIEAVLEHAYWGTLTSADNGKQLVFTVEYDPSHVPDGSIGYFSKGATFTFYNDSLKAIADFHLRTSDTTYSIDIMRDFSTGFFNTDEKMEFMIFAHSFIPYPGGGPASCRDTVYIVNENGEILQKLGQSSGASLHKTDPGFSGEKRIQIFHAYYSDLSDTIYTSIYKARDILKEDRTPLYTFRIPDNLTSYSEGPLAAFSYIDGKPYYVTTQYEKPFIANGNHAEPEVEMNNKFNIMLFKTDFTPSDTISLPLIGIEENNFSMSSLLYFDEYMFSRKIFNSDEGMEIIYGMSRYDISCDCEKLQFYLMGEDGRIIKEMADGVSSVIKLQDIPGESDEYALLLGGGDMINAIEMYGMPAMQENFTFPAVHEGELLSVNFERVPNINGSYEYVFGLGRGESTDNTVYGGIAYYDREGKSVKRVRIDLGQNALSFQPIISNMTMNPYFFVPDNQQEYLYFLRYINPNGTMGGGFGIANEDTTLYLWTDNNDDGTFQGAGLRANEDQTVLKNLYITFDNGETVKHTFYKLPLQDITLQGEGTAENPYIITTPSELDHARNYPNAHFILGNDINMAAFTGVGQKGFVSLPDFGGNFDGRNHAIKNLTLAGEGLFGNITANGEVSNLFLKNVVFSDPDLTLAGAITGRIGGGSIRNCHVETDITSASANSTLGGLVGQAAIRSTIDQCSFSGNITAPYMEQVGGIAGALMTGSIVSNSFMKGNVNAASSAGGIAGSAMNEATVTNSYSSANVTTTYQAGGIVGHNNSGRIIRTYSTGNIQVDQNDSPWNKGLAGGIAGETAIGMMGGYVKYSFALNDTIVATENRARIAYTEFYEDFQGRTAMDSNYALSTMLLGEDRASLTTVNDTNCKENRMHGQSGTLDEFDQDFYEKVTWAFGEDSLAPWKMTGNTPRLWYEFNVRSIELSLVSATIKKDSSLTLQANVIPSDATNKEVRWSTSDARIVSVNQSGVVKGISAGKAVITARTSDGGFTASCEVTVTIPVEKVIFSEKELHIAPLVPVTLSTTVLPENASNKNVLYYSLNPEIVTAGGNVIYASTIGTARIVAISEDGEASDTCTVHVAIPVEEIYLNETNITLDAANPTFQLEAEVYPDDATDTRLVWKSADGSVASVSANGLVSAHTKGVTDITVSTVDETVSAICIVTVTENVANEAEMQSRVRTYVAGDNIVVAASSEIESVQVWNISGQGVVHRPDTHTDKVYIPAANLTRGVYLLKTELVNGSTAISKIIR